MGKRHKGEEELRSKLLSGTSTIISPEGSHPATIEGLEEPVPRPAPQTHVEHSFRKEYGSGRTWRPNPNSVGDRPTGPPSRSQSRRSAKAPLPDLDAAVYITNAQVRQLVPVCFGHCPAGPMGCLVRRLGARQFRHLRRGFRFDRCLAGLAGLVAQQTLDPGPGKALLPAPHCRPADPEALRHLLRRMPIHRGKQDAHPLDVLARPIAVGGDQRLALCRRSRNQKFLLFQPIHQVSCRRGIKGREM
jgi:hypothetical protein